VEATAEALGRVSGAYSLVVMNETELMGIRDPHGFRPLSLGRLGASWVLAGSGIIIGVMALTGLGGRITAALMALSGNSLILALFLTMIVSFILGMGLPTTAAYVICASTIAPALTHMGIPPLAAHMFIFYFACLSAITPPVALAAFAAAGIAQTGLWGVGLCAVKIAAAGYIIPYMFLRPPAGDRIVGIAYA
jgi:TRAP-type uncharacterized transport system fused permease subunit